MPRIIKGYRLWLREGYNLKGGEIIYHALGKTLRATRDFRTRNIHTGTTSFFFSSLFSLKQASAQKPHLNAPPPYLVLESWRKGERNAAQSYGKEVISCQPLSLIEQEGYIYPDRQRLASLNSHLEASCSKEKSVNHPRLFSALRGSYDLSRFLDDTLHSPP